jgi:TolA-binding protein
MKAEIKLWFGQYYYETSRFDKALQNFNEVMDLFPGTPYYDDAQYWSGWVLFDKGMVEESFSRFRRVADAGSKNKWSPQAMLAMGEIHEKNGDIQQALEEYQDILTVHPEGDTAKLANNRIGGIFKEQGKYMLAAEHFRIALSGENSPLNAQIQYDIAECYEKAGHIEKAAEEYLKVEYNYPKGRYWVARSLLNCARLMEKNGDNRSAVRLYRKLSEMEGPEAEEARTRLRSLRMYTR